MSDTTTTVATGRREIEVNREVIRLGFTGGLVEAVDGLGFEAQWEKFAGTVLHGAIEGEHGTDLFVMIDALKVYLPMAQPRQPVMIIDDQNMAQYAYELEPWQTAVDSYVAAINKGLPVAGKMRGIAAVFGSASQSYIRAKIMKGDTTPGFQAIALCGDGNLRKGEIGINSDDAEKLVRDLVVDRSPNARAVFAKLVDRVWTLDRGVAKEIDAVRIEDDAEAIRTITDLHMALLVSAMSGMFNWAVRYPVTDVPPMVLVVLTDAPASGIYITTHDMKTLFNGDFDGDQMFFTLIGLTKAKMPDDRIVALRPWNDKLVPQSGQAFPKTRLGLRDAKGKLHDLHFRLKKADEHINGNPSRGIANDLSVMLGFEQRNWVGIVTFLAWQLGWVVMNMVNHGQDPEISDEEFAKTIFEGLNSLCLKPGVICMDEDTFLRGIVDPDRPFMGTTRREWARMAYTVVVQLLESCFDARKVTNTALAARLSVHIVACLKGEMGIDEAGLTIRAAYKDLGVPKMAKTTIDLLKMVARAQGMVDHLKLMDDYVGTGQSLVWAWTVTKKSRGDWATQLLLEAEKLGKTDFYGWILEELSFEKIERWVPEPKEEKPQSEADKLKAFDIDDPKFPDPRLDYRVCELARGEATRAEYEARHARFLREYIHAGLIEAEMGEEIAARVKILPYDRAGNALTGPQFKAMRDEGRENLVQYKLHYICPGTDAYGNPVVDKATGKATEAVIDLPQMSLLPKKYSPGMPPARMQVIKAQEGTFLFRPRLTNIHFGKLAGRTLAAGPIAVAQSLCQARPIAGGQWVSPWVIEDFETLFARAIVAGIIDHEGEKSSGRRNPRAAQLASFIYEPAQNFLRSLEVYSKSGAQLRVLGEEIELDFDATCGGRRLAQTTEQAIKCVLWKFLLKLGYSTVATSKSKNGTVAQWRGGRIDPLWMAGVNPLLAASRKQRTLRELRSVLKQGLTYTHHERGRQRVVNAFHEIATEFSQTTMECLTIYCDTEQTTLAEWVQETDEEGDPLFNDDGSPMLKYVITSPDQGKIFPAAFDRLEAYEVKNELFEAGFMTEHEIAVAAEAAHPGAVVNYIYRRTGAGLKRQVQLSYNAMRPGNGAFKVTFTENVVKFMAIPTTVQWYAQVGGEMLPLHVLASRQSMFDKDGFVGGLRAMMSLTSTYDSPWVVADNLDIDGINALMPQAEERLAESGIVDSTGAPSGRVPIYDGPDPTTANYMGDHMVGWQTVVRTPHDDLTSNKVKGVKHDPHVRHLGDIPFFENNRVRQQVNRYANAIMAFGRGASYFEEVESGEAAYDDGGDHGYDTGSSFSSVDDLT